MVRGRWTSGSLDSSIGPAVSGDKKGAIYSNKKPYKAELPKKSSQMLSSLPTWYRNILNSAERDYWLGVEAFKDLRIC